jgi:hypothetical protein
VAALAATLPRQFISLPLDVSTSGLLGKARLHNHRVLSLRMLCCLQGAHHDADMIVTNHHPEALPLLTTRPEDLEPEVQPVAQLLSDYLCSIGQT